MGEHNWRKGRCPGAGSCLRWVLARSGDAINLKLHLARCFMERESYLFICVNGKTHRFTLFTHKNNLSGDITSRKPSVHSAGAAFDLKKYFPLKLASKHWIQTKPADSQNLLWKYFPSPQSLWGRSLNSSSGNFWIGKLIRQHYLPFVVTRVRRCVVQF